MYGRRSQFGPVMTDSPILSVLTVVNWHVNSVNQQHRPHQWFFTTGLENVWQPQKCILSWKMFGNLKKMHLILENGWQPQQMHLILSLWCNSKKLYIGQQSFWQSWQKLLSGQKQPVCRISSSNQMTNVIFIHLQKCEIWNVKNLWRVGGAIEAKKVNVEVNVLPAPLPPALVWKIALRVQIWKDHGSKSKNAWFANSSLPLEIAFLGILN